MKKLFVLLLILSFIISCSAINKILKRETEVDTIPLLINNQDIIVDDSLEKATAEGKILEGMTPDMVEKSWGIPKNKISRADGFIIWEYDNNNLYFLEKVLITWDEHN